MWPLLANTRTLALAVAVLCAGVVGWQVNGWRLKAQHESELKAMYAAGVKATQRREVQIASLREQSREDAERIARLSRGGRVYACPSPAPDRLPGDSNAGPAAPSGSGREDVTELLEAFLKCGGEVNRALK